MDNLTADVGLMGDGRQKSGVSTKADTFNETN